MKKHISLPALIIAVIALFAFQPAPRKLFILGDSISLGYGVYLERYLKGEYEIQRKGSQENAMKNLDVPVDANGGNSRMVLDYLQSRAADTSFQPDLMLLNCGLHDIKRDPATLRIAIDSTQYRSNLEAICRLLRGKKIPVVWVRTTEVIDSVHAAKSKAFSRFSKDVEQYNHIADETCKKFKVPEIDLYSFTQKQGIDRFADHVHYISRVVNEQAKYIIEFLNTYSVKKK